MPVHMLRSFVQAGVPVPGCRRCTPAPDLAGIVDAVYVYTDVHTAGATCALSDGLPSLVLLADAPAAVRVVHEGRDAVRRGGYLTAPVMEHTAVELPHPVQNVMVVRFTCTGLYSVLPRPVASLRRQSSWSVEELWGGAAHDLTARLYRAGRMEEKLAVVEEFLRTRMQHRENALFGEAVAMIRAARGRTAIDEVCRSLRLNYRWLERQFGTYLGMAPKEYARLNRFVHAVLDWQQSGDAWGVAVRNGYYDHSHFARECRRFTGRAPGAIERGMVS